MGKFQALALAGAALAGFSTFAYGADLLPPPPMPVYAAPVEFGGWYLRGDVGVGVNQLNGLRSTFNQAIPDFGSDGFNLTDSAIVGVGAGYQFNSWFRADVTGEYRFANHYKGSEHYSGSPNCATGSGYLCVDGYRGSISSGVFLANGYFDLGTWYSITPYVGAGVGGAYHTFANLTDYGLTNPGAYGTASDHGSFQFAWALMAGVSYNLSPNLKLDFGYRYLNMGTASSNAINCQGGGNCPNEIQRVRLSSQDVRIGLRYLFADTAPLTPALAPYAPPLVRKY